MKKGKVLKWADKWESVLVLGIMALMVVELAVLWVRK